MALIFDYTIYKDYLRAIIKEKSSQRGFQSALAKAAECQPSYLSQVLTGKAELIPDHAAKMAPFIGLSLSETEYFIELVNLARANSHELKKILSDKISQRAEKKSDLSERIPGMERIKEFIENFYFTSWHWSAIHMATSIPEFQSAEAIADRLSLSQGRVMEVLQKLESCGFVQVNNSRWTYEKGGGHLPAQSVMTELNHTHWRHRALLDIQNQQKQALHYTSVFSMSKKDIDPLREFFFKTIASSRSITDPSDSQEIFCFNLDFFKV